MINISKDFEHRETLVFYSAPDILVQRSSLSSPEVEKKNGDKVIIPFHLKPHSNRACRYNERVLLTSTHHALLIDKDANYEYFDLQQPQIVTDLHVRDNKLIFGTLFGMFFQFVIYDLENRKRLFQTQSTSATTLSYLVTKDYIYCLLGNSQLVCFDHEGKEVWKRFEHQYVVPGLAHYKGALLYCSNNQLKITTGKTTSSITVPLVKLDKIEAIVNDDVYAVCNGRKNICSFNISREQLLYEVKTDEKMIIRKLLMTEGKTDQGNLSRSVLLFSNDLNIGAIDTKKGSLLFYTPLLRLRSIVQNDEIIATNHAGKSHLLRETTDAVIKA